MATPDVLLINSPHHQGLANLRRHFSSSTKPPYQMSRHPSVSSRGTPQPDVPQLHPSIELILDDSAVQTTSCPQLEKLLTHNTTQLIDICNYRDFENPIIPRALAKHVHTTMAGETSTGIPLWINVYKRVADISPDFHAEVLSTSAVAYDKTGRGTVMLSVALTNCTDNVMRTGQILTQWRRIKGQWKCYNWQMLFGVEMASECIEVENAELPSVSRVAAERARMSREPDAKPVTRAFSAPAKVDETGPKLYSILWDGTRQRNWFIDTS